MNEFASFLPFVEVNPFRYSIETERPPTPPPVREQQPRPIPGFDFSGTINGTADNTTQSDTPANASRRSVISEFGLSQHLFARQQDNSTRANLADNVTDASLDSALMYPPYRIQDRRATPSVAEGASNSVLKNISDFTLRVDSVHYTGETEVSTYLR